MPKKSQSSNFCRKHTRADIREIRNNPHRRLFIVFHYYTLTHGQNLLNQFRLVCRVCVLAGYIFERGSLNTLVWPKSFFVWSGHIKDHAGAYKLTGLWCASSIKCILLIHLPVFWRCTIIISQSWRQSTRFVVWSGHKTSSVVVLIDRRWELQNCPSKSKAIAKRLSSQLLSYNVALLPATVGLNDITGVKSEK